jgi:hypothetical protein
MLAAYQPYASNIANVATNFTQWEITDQALSQSSQGPTVALLNLFGAQSFPGADNQIKLATYNLSNIDWPLHSPSLIALALETQTTVTVTVHSISVCRSRAQFNAFDNS